MPERFVGLDLGATKISAVLLEGDGAIGQTRWLEHGGGPAALELAQSVAGELVAQPEVVAVGVAVAGLVTPATGTVVHAARLGLRGLALGASWQSRWGLPVLVDNDATATLAAILADPAHRPSQAAVALLALGTGIGGALALGSELLRGRRGFAAELGHLPVEYPPSTPCVCGGRGCLELYASGTAIGQLGLRQGPAGGAAGGQAAGSAGAVGAAREVVLAADRGQGWAREALEEAGGRLAQAVLSLSAALDVELVYLSGSFGHAGAHHLIPAMRAQLAALLPFSGSRPVPAVRLDPLGPRAAAIGAARLARAAFGGQAAGS